MKVIGERVAGYSYRFWQRHGMEEWPTVAQAANALKIRRSEIDDCSGDGFYQLTGYNVEDRTLGQLFVEATTPDVDAAWCQYWLPWSHRCNCGRHKAGQ